VLTLLAQGAFGEAFLAIRREDLFEKDGKTLQFAELGVTCSQELFLAPVSKWVIKRCLPADHDSFKDLFGRPSQDAKQRYAETVLAFNEERQRASKIAFKLRRLKEGFRHIVEYHTEVKDPTRNTSAMVFAYCNGGDLLHLLKRLPAGTEMPVDIVVDICRQVVSALSTLMLSTVRVRSCCRFRKASPQQVRLFSPV
jgi:serine/threonine protein kinase